MESRFNYFPPPSLSNTDSAPLHWAFAAHIAGPLPPPFLSRVCAPIGGTILVFSHAHSDSTWLVSLSLSTFPLYMHA